MSGFVTCVITNIRIHSLLFPRLNLLLNVYHFTRKIMNWFLASWTNSADNSNGRVMATSATDGEIHNRKLDEKIQIRRVFISAKGLSFGVICLDTAIQLYGSQKTISSRMGFEHTSSSFLVGRSTKFTMQDKWAMLWAISSRIGIQHSYRKERISLYIIRSAHASNNWELSMALHYHFSYKFVGERSTNCLIGLEILIQTVSFEPRHIEAGAH